MVYCRKAMLRSLWPVITSAVMLTAFLGCQGPYDNAWFVDSLPIHRSRAGELCGQPFHRLSHAR